MRVKLSVFETTPMPQPGYCCPPPAMYVIATSPVGLAASEGYANAHLSFQIARCRKTLKSAVEMVDNSMCDWLKSFLPSFLSTPSEYFVPSRRRPEVHATQMLPFTSRAAPPTDCEKPAQPNGERKSWLSGLNAEQSCVGVVA